MTVAFLWTATEPTYWAQTVYEDLKTGAVIAGSSFVSPITKLSKRYAAYNQYKPRVFSRSVSNVICQQTTAERVHSVEMQTHARQGSVGTTSHSTIVSSVVANANKCAFPN